MSAVLDRLRPAVSLGLRVVVIVAGLGVLALGGARPVAGVQPGEMLDDPVLEARARDISAILRCLVCRNESIDESEADLARDLRLLVRERLRRGESNDQVIAYIRARYGDYVLLDPPVTMATALLWVGPGLLFAVVFWAGWRRWRGSGESLPILDAAHKPRVAALLDEKTDGKSPGRDSSKGGDRNR